MIVMVSTLLRILPLFPTPPMRVSSFIGFAVRVVLPFPILVLVVQAIFPAPLVVRVSVKSSFVSIFPVPVLISLMFLLVITTIVLRHGYNQSVATKRQKDRQRHSSYIHSSSIRFQICLV